MTNRSTGNRSTGNRSTGHWSTGDCSTGDCSTGHWSTGDWSTGNWSTGHYSTGDWSTGNWSTGHFSTEDYSGFSCFDKPITLEDWNNAEKPDFLYFSLTAWIMTDKMTESEKQENPSYAKTGGFLKSYAYKEAFQKSYNEASREDQLKVERLPNFNADKFFQISGIDVKAKVEELTMEQICNELGREIKIKK